MDFTRYEFRIKEDLLPRIIPDKHIIVDLETTGLEPPEDIIICGGIFDCKKRIIRIYFLPDPKKHENFKRFLRNTILWYKNKGYEIWAYNSEFEEDFLSLRNVIRDLMVYWICKPIPFEERDEFTLRRTKMTTATDEIILDILKDKEIVKRIDEICNGYVSSSLIPRIYLKQWLLKRDDEAVRQIVHHNYVDLIREYFALWFIYKSIRDIKRLIAKEFYIIPREIIRALDRIL